MSKQILCPFCFTPFDEGELKYVCLDCGQETIAKNATSRELKKGINCKTASCHQRLVHTKKCPICNETLPDALFDTTNLPFSLIGSSGSGKTNYITVLLNELSRRTRNLKLSLEAQNHETLTSYEDNRRIVYDDRMSLPATTPMSERPSIWTVKNSNRRVMGNPLSYVLNIFDGAGETHNNLLSESAQRDARYIEHSKAVIFVIDPLRFSGLRSLANRIDPNNYKNSSALRTESNNSVTVIQNTAKLIRKALRLKSNAPIDMFVAIVIAKMDLFLDSEFSGTKFAQETPHPNLGCFDMQDCLAIDKELTNWLIDNDEQEFITALEQNFRFTQEGLLKKKKCFLFGTSAFGSAPDSHGSLPTIHPHRVLDPILWLLAQQDFIDIK